jgi:hypothetical protein
MMNKMMNSRGGIDYGLDERLPLDSLVGSASMKN